MSSPNVNYNQSKTIKRTVFFTGSTALTKGMGVCFDLDYTSSATGEAATDALQKRFSRVELPSATNNRAFAGVVTQSYAAKTGGQWVDIAEPGSEVVILTTVATTIGYGAYVTCQAGGTDAGKFTTVGLMGRGTAQVVQTDADGGAVLARLIDGPESGLVEKVTPVTGTLSCMVGGVTRFQAATIGTSDARVALADGVFQGARKVFECEGTMTTNDVMVVAAGKIWQNTAATALDAVELDADGEDIDLEWIGAKWHILNKTTGTGSA
jgi:hypothetical protein